MKKLIIIGLSLVLLASATEARKKQKKAGVVTDGVFMDAQYNLKMTVSENWKPKVGKDKDVVRLRLTQRNFSVPSDYIDAPDYTYTPQVVMYVDTSSFGAHVFIDSLTSPDYRSDQKNSILKEFDLLNESDLIPKRRTRAEIAGESALIWNAQAKYTKEVQVSASSSSGKRVQRSYGGAIVAVKLGEDIVLFQVMAEWEFFEAVMTEVMQMVESLEVVQDEDEG